MIAPSRFCLFWVASLIVGTLGCKEKIGPLRSLPAEKIEPTTSAGSADKVEPVASAPPESEKVEPWAPPKAMKMPPANETRVLAKGANAFAVDLWGHVGRTPGNLAISPASVGAALAMVAGGAKGETDSQIRTVLHMNGDARTEGARWGYLLRALESPSRPITLRIANRLFGEKTLAFDKSYIEWTDTSFGASLLGLNFKGSAESSHTHINTWVDERTQHRIKDLLPPGSVNEQTRLVVVNAIYFLATWANPFEKESTYPQAFFVTRSQKKKVPMMHDTGYPRVAEVGKVKLLELPYEGESASMLFVLPKAVDGLADVESSLTASKIDDYARAVSSMYAEVSLPRFEIHTKALSLGENLKALGMPLAFDPIRAEFTGIAANGPTPEQRLFISNVFHKAFVKVDEKGTEAAAATTVGEEIGLDGEPPEPFKFTADHPFLFFLRDNVSGLILFMGRVTNPSIGD
ncbi:MAG: serpin family protein [Polyangiaceae bacterium]|nr:serpin family protein [Polyangiaceae bacterium]